MMAKEEEDDGEEGIEIRRSGSADEISPLDSVAVTTYYKEIPVVVRNASKCFSQRRTQNNVLVDLNLTVTKGSIYGLLGPSGCGKTTLLKCIIGRLSLDKGNVWTFGETPGTPESSIPGARLGYMPQEDALDGVMSIKEILYYYGCLLCVPEKQILEKIAFLVSFLKLPTEKMRFSSLSGGQKRRVSFAVSLIHDAELLILDEPTVGVDPILKKNIWDYLLALVKGGNKTVIITTHYIEEARRANNVGMMFEGRLLIEGDPNLLISQHRRSTLEDVFFNVCVNQKKLDGRLTGGGGLDNDLGSGSSSVPLLADEGPSISTNCATADKMFQSFHSMHCETMQSDSIRDNIFYRAILEYFPDVRGSRIKAVVYRGFIQLFRYPGLLFLIMAAPSFQIALCGFALGRPITSIEIGVVNEDTGRSASRYLSHVDSEVIIQTNFTSWEAARQAVLDGRMWGALKFGHNFSNALLDRYNKTPFVDQRTILESNVNVSLDGTKTIRFVLLDAYKKFVSEFLSGNNMEPELASIPIVTDEPVFGKGDDPYSFFIMPSFITASSFFAQMGLAIVGLFLDKDGGKLERIYIAGVTPFEVVFGFLMIQLSVMVAEVVFMLVTALVIFKFSNEGSILLVITLCMLQGMCGTTLGLLIAASSSKFTSTTTVCMTIIVSSVAFGGFMWPVEATSIVVRYVCLVSPFALAANAMRNIMYRRWSLLHPEVSNGFGITFIWILVFLLSTVIVLRVKKSG